LPVSQLGKWKAAAEMAGVGAFLAFQTSVLLGSTFGASISVVVGLDWAARILLWTAAALALTSGAQYVAVLTRRA
jgi:phosphatidylglycerophosphate synthase